MKCQGRDSTNYGTVRGKVKLDEWRDGQDPNYVKRTLRDKYKGCLLWNPKWNGMT